MKPVSADDEGQRELERRALHNASWLAEKLGYRDAIDRTTERWLVISIAACVVAATAWVVVSMRAKASEDEAQLQRQRCEVQMFVAVYPEKERLVRERRPKLPARQQAQLARSEATDEARGRCARDAKAQ